MTINPVKRPAMRRFVVGAALRVAVGAGLLPILSGTTRAQRGAIAIVGVNVVPMDADRVIPNQTVVIRGQQIMAIGARTEIDVPDGSTMIDGRGKYLIPGLAEMHAHVPQPQQEQSIGAGYTENVLFLYVASGVTTIRGMLGHPTHLDLRRRIRDGELIAPTLYTSGPSFNGNSAPDPGTAIRMVREQKAAGYDFLKIHPGLSRATFDALSHTADSVGIRFAGHVPADVGLARALEAGYASIDHLDGYVEALAAGRASSGASTGFFGANLVDVADESRLADLARVTRDARVWNVPTQILIAGFGGGDDPDAAGRQPEMRYMPPQVVAAWVRQKREFQQQPGYSIEQTRRFVALRGRIIKALHDAGAGLILGSDAPQVMNVPGFSALAELHALVDAGLTPYEALETGTRSAAVYFGTLDRTGTIAVGKVADLVLLNANPLTDIRHVRDRAGVVLRGRWLPTAEIQRRLDAIATAYTTK